MIDHSAVQNDEQVFVSNLLATMATGLLLVFAASVIVDGLPIQLLNPNWQMRTIARLLATSSLALVGFGLLHIAALINPSNLPLKARVSKARHIAVAVTIGFLLLIPLQGFATWRTFSLANQNEQMQVKAANKTLTPIKREVNEATSTEDLQKRLLALKQVNVQIQPSDLSTPLPELKKDILINLERAENIMKNKISESRPIQIWAATQAGLRVILASLGYALAFAAGAQAPNASETLLENFTNRWAQKSGRRRRRRQPLPFPVDEQD
jgi:hypothetical protein